MVKQQSSFGLALHYQIGLFNYVNEIYNRSKEINRIVHNLAKIIMQAVSYSLNCFCPQCIAIDQFFLAFLSGDHIDPP